MQIVPDRRQTAADRRWAQSEAAVTLHAPLLLRLPRVQSSRPRDRRHGEASSLEEVATEANPNASSLEEVARVERVLLLVRRLVRARQGVHLG